jgi:transposase-like protein
MFELISEYPCPVCDGKLENLTGFELEQGSLEFKTVIIGAACRTCHSQFTQHTLTTIDLYGTYRQANK